MTRKDLSTLIHKKIPISKAMGLSVSKCSVRGGVEFKLPLKPNHNHKNTAFGGSLVAAQALACWSWMMALLDDENIVAEIVVMRQNSDFLRPVTKNFKVNTDVVSKDKLDRFIHILSRKGKARLTVTARVTSGNTSIVDAHYKGEYVAIVQESK